MSFMCAFPYIHYQMLYDLQMISVELSINSKQSNSGCGLHNLPHAFSRTAIVRDITASAGALLG